MEFWGKLDIYGFLNKLIRYLWMLKVHILIVCHFPDFEKSTNQIVFAHFFQFLAKQTLNFLS